MFNQAEIEKETDKFHGFYRGIVESNSDPLENGRVQIRVYPMFADVNATALPWAIYADTGMGGAADVGTIKVPSVGAHVFCFFENGDHRFPVYFAGAPAIQNNVPDAPTLSRQSDASVTAINNARQTAIPKAGGGTWDEPASAYAAVYPDNKVIRSDKGIVVEMDDTDLNVRLHIYHPSGTRDEINNIGDEVHHVAGKYYEVVISDNNLYIKGSYNVTVVGDANIKAGGNVNVEVGGNLQANVTGTTTIDSTGAATVTAPSTTVNGPATVNGDVTTHGNVLLDGGGGDIVTTQHICAFTGANHLAGSSTCKAKI